MPPSSRTLKHISYLGVFLCPEKVSAADTTWQKDFEYTLDESDQYIQLGKYLGDATNLTVPAKAAVNGKEYTTYLF